MSQNDKYDFYAYVSDDLGAFSVKLSQAVAASGGFTEKVSPSVFPPWTFGREFMRWGEYVDADDHTLHLPIARNDDPVWNNTVDITHRGRHYYVIGFHEERINWNALAR